MMKTLYDKLWESHVVRAEDDGTTILYIDRHLVHEVTSPQAFDGLRAAGRQPWRVSANLAVADHNVPTTGRADGIADPVSRLQVETLDSNAKAYGLTYRPNPGFKGKDSLSLVFLGATAKARGTSTIEVQISVD